MKEDEPGSYVPGKGYVPRKKKELTPQPPDIQRTRSPMVVSGSGNPLQEIISNIFGTVPRNKLKEAGLEDK
jgi:hypothetical protein